MLLPTVRLKAPRNSRHPHIFRKMVEHPRGAKLPPGSLVRVVGRDGRGAGVAFYHPENTIALRVLSDEPDATPDAAFFVRRLARAKALREEWLRLPERGDSYRLAHGEADRLPGLAVDKLGDTLVAEVRVAGWLHAFPWIAGALASLYPGAAVGVRAAIGAAEAEGVSFAPLEARWPLPASANLTEDGLRYRADFARGHKTGFFLDQRDNRRRVREFARGRAVLDLGCYTGGFALSAWAGGAERVTAVDLDDDAVRQARVNLGLNAGAGDPKRVSFRHGDFFEVLRDETARGARWDMVVLDPPKWAATAAGAAAALERYADANRLAARAVADGGLLVTCSCSGPVPGEAWLSAVRRAAAAAGRSLQILEIAGPGADHPWRGDCPEGRYLKVLFARIGDD